jgi:hypothetical protein
MAACGSTGPEEKIRKKKNALRALIIEASASWGAACCAPTKADRKRLWSA